MNELREQGYEPDGITLTEDEARYVMEANFGMKKGDPLPEHMELFALPVRIKDE